MTSFMSFHAAAAERGDGLRRELLALRAGATPCFDLTTRYDGMLQSGPDPASKAFARVGAMDPGASPNVPSQNREPQSVSMGRFGSLAHSPIDPS
jgi:hypothetical protein